LLGLGMPDGFEWIIILGIGLLIFGKRIPEVVRSLGRGIVAFKGGFKALPAAPPLWLIAAMAGAVVCAWWVTRSR
jgi:TatA/E family protein of Tat protein translocase